MRKRNYHFSVRDGAVWLTADNGQWQVESRRAKPSDRAKDAAAYDAAKAEVDLDALQDKAPKSFFGGLTDRLKGMG